MNKSNIEWCIHSWNPVTGCLHDCGYCYARGIAKRFKKGQATISGYSSDGHGLYRADPGAVFPRGFEPTFYVDRLKEPALTEKPSHIFTVSMGDLFGAWVPQEWIDRVLGVIQGCPQHTFTILTKNSERLREYAAANPVPDNVIFGASLTGGQDTRNGWQLPDLEVARVKRRVVSLEPFTSPIPEDSLYILQWTDWLIIGGQTGPKPFQPPAEWIRPLVDWARRRGIPVFVKDNCGYPEVVREYPEGVPH